MSEAPLQTMTADRAPADGAPDTQAPAERGGAEGRSAEPGAVVRAQRPAIVCEGCGYELTGSPVWSDCPECGRSASLSLPSRRQGSAWQRAGSLVALPVAYGVTSAAMVRRPRGAWERVRVEHARSWLLVVVNAALASFVAWVGIAYTGTGEAMRQPLAGVGFVAEGVGILGGLTVIEWIGLQLIGRKHRWRVSPAVASAVCGGASVGWLGAGVLVAVGWQVGAVLPSAPIMPMPGWLPAILGSPQFLVPAAGFAVGLVVFEALVYAGLRRMRFANAEAKGSAA